MLSFLFVEEGKLFIIVFLGIQTCFLLDVAHGLFWNATKALKFLLNFQIHFALYGQDNYVFENNIPN